MEPIEWTLAGVVVVAVAAIGATFYLAAQCGKARNNLLKVRKALI